MPQKRYFKGDAVQLEEEVRWDGVIKNLAFDFTLFFPMT
jgi:hypothetical protein